MDVFVRAIAIFLEVLVLAALIYCFLNAVRLIVFDFGIKKEKFNKVLVMGLLAIGGVLVAFFATHLVTLYPRL